VIVVACALALAAVAAAVTWLAASSRKRLMEDVPTSAVAGVALGLNELVGVVRHPEPLVSPIGRTSCVWWQLERLRKDNGSWKRVEVQRGALPGFWVEDPTGSLPCRLDGARVRARIVHEEVRGGDDLLRGAEKLVERALTVDRPVYVLGTATLPEDAPGPVLGPDPDGRDPYLVAAHDEETLLAGHRLTAAVTFVATPLLGAAAATAYTDLRVEGEGWALDSVTPLPPALTAGFVLAALGFAWVVQAYNGFARLLHRTRRAWALIEVELARRHDLVVSLAQVVRAHRDAEAEVQRLLAEVRAGQAAAAAGPCGPRVGELDTGLRTEAAALGHLFARIEATPTLRADASFRALQHRLVVTEDRLALARSFYNASVEVLADRTRTYPSAALLWFFHLDLDARFTTGGPERAISPMGSSPALRD
jgi:hypothetical protein